MLPSDLREAAPIPQPPDASARAVRDGNTALESPFRFHETRGICMQDDPAWEFFDSLLGALVGSFDPSILVVILKYHFHSVTGVEQTNSQMRVLGDGDINAVIPNFPASIGNPI